MKIDYWLVAFNDGRTIIIEGEDLYDVHQELCDDSSVVSVVRLSKELVKEFAIDKIREM